MDATRGMTLSMARDGDQIVIRVRGQLDFATASELVAAVETAANSSYAACALDFELVTFIDSEALKSLLALRDVFAERGKTLYMSTCSSQVNRTITILGIDRNFNCDFAPSRLT